MCWQLMMFSRKVILQNILGLLIGFVSKLIDILDIASLIQRKCLALAFDYIVLANSDLPQPPNVCADYCFPCFKMSTNKTEKLQNLLIVKIDHNVYCCSFGLTSNTHNPQ